MAEPSQLTDQYNALLTTTLRAMLDAEVRDNIGRGNKLLMWLKNRGGNSWRSQDGGERVRVPLMYGLNSTADIYSGFSMTYSHVH
jgi:hypothetical protein